MTIEEAIRHAKEVARRAEEERQEVADNDAAEQCRWEHAELAAWLEETLALRERIKALEGRIGVMAERVPESNECPPDDVLQANCHTDCAQCWREWGLG